MLLISQLTPLGYPVFVVVTIAYCVEAANKYGVTEIVAIVGEENESEREFPLYVPDVNGLPDGNPEDVA